MYSLIKRILFLLPPESAHAFSLFWLDLAAAWKPTRFLLEKSFCLPDDKLSRTLMGIRFPNPVGLAAGFDKNATHLLGMHALGFGFIEVGTVTPKAQTGNPKPRLFRLPDDQALINRMGFNNLGVEAMAKSLEKIRKHPLGQTLVIGGNIGKNKSTPNENAAADYLACFHKLFPLVDYFVVNVSSPNTPNLRELQEKEPLTQLLRQLQDANRQMPQPKPILLKIAPDLNDTQVDDIADIVRLSGLAGVIISNTTIERKNLKTQGADIQKIGAGGLSGPPVRERSTTLIRTIREKIGTDLVVIGIGGINSPASADEKLAAGADLIQIYTGLIYEGPFLIKNILQSILSFNLRQTL